MSCRRVILLSGICLSLLFQGNLAAMFMYEETKLVPIERVFANTREKLSRATNDFESTYVLARLYAMSYATNLTEMPVGIRSDQPKFYSPASLAGVPAYRPVFKSPEARAHALAYLTNAIAFYERSLTLLGKSTNANEARWWVVPVQLGLAWCLDESTQRQRALVEYRRGLGLAWRQEVTGDFNFKEWASGVWADVSAGKSPFHAQTRGSLGPGVCYSEEIIGYLLRLLDPKKDASEIAELTRRKQILAGMGRAVTPILLPVGPGVFPMDLVDPRAQVLFDLDGSGLARRWGWITPNAAWLVYDPESTGQFTSGLQLFGSVTFWIFWCDGYAALASLDDNQDGFLSGKELRGLALWQDRNGNGISEPGEVRPLSDYGIVALSCLGSRLDETTTWNPAGVIFNTGETRPTYDWMAPSK